MIFNKYAKCYNLFYQDKDYKRESNYIDTLIKRYAPKAKEILDFGCGTGGHDFIFAEKGYNVTGVDNSQKMLDIATVQLVGHKDKAKLDFYKGNIQALKLDKRFDVVMALFHVINYQVSNEELYATFKNAYRHLKASGIFIFDFWYGPGVLNNKPEIRVKKIEDKGAVYSRIATPRLYPNENRVDIHYKILIENKKNKSRKCLNEIHRIRYLFLPELKFMLKEIGFKIEKQLKWLSAEKKLGFDSWYGLLIARR